MSAVCQMGFFAHGDGGDFQHRRLLGVAVAARILAVRPVRHAFAGDRHPFDDDLGHRRHFDVDGFALHQLDGRAAQAAGDVKFVDAVGHPRLRRDHDRGFHADRGGHRQTLAIFLSL